MPFVNCNKFNTSQALQDQAIADLAQELLTKQNALKDCSGNPLAGNVPTCAQMTTAIQTAIDALPADKFLQGLQSYNPATNTMTLLMSDGSTVDIDMTDLLADAVSGGTTPTGAAGGDLQGTYPNPTVVPASTTQAGKVELATNTEALAGTSTTLAVTPAGLKAAIDAAPDSDAQTLSVGASGISISNGNTIDAISNDNGNLLQWRADGAYYGIEAPANTSNLYFSNSGDDANAGTRASPKQNPLEAYKLNNIGTNFTIYLDETSTFIFDSAEFVYHTNGKSAQFFPYGAQTDYAIANANSAAYYVAAECGRYEILFRSSKSFLNGVVPNEDPRVIISTAQNNGQTRFYAGRLDTTATANLPMSSRRNSFLGDAYGSAASEYAGAFGFFGCELKTGNDFYLLHNGGNTSVSVSTCLWTKGIGDKLFSAPVAGQGIFSAYVSYLSGAMQNSNGLTYFAATPVAGYAGAIAGETGRISANVATTTFP